MEKATFENKTYYDLLGIERDASLDEIKKAYRTLARKFHPDSHHSDTETIELEEVDLSQTRVFKILTFAYHILKDPALREEYDRSLPPLVNNWAQPVADEIGAKLENYSSHKNPSQAVHTFGALAPNDDEPVEALVEDWNGQSIANMMHKRKGFFSKLFWFIK